MGRFGSRGRRAVTAGLLLAGIMLGSAATAETHVLVMGGGGKPESNQASLEKNVNYFRRIAGRLGLLDAPRDVLFACGDDRSQDDLEYIHSAVEDGATQRLLDALIEPGAGRSTRYRPHDVGGGELASSQQQISGWFDDHAEQIGADDKLLIYFTGHGGKGEDDNAQNTTLYLWPNHSMRMQHFVQELDKVDPQTPVVMVMVQCYSGGFANVIFNGGNADQGLSKYDRCGFYAAVHDRTAAGCTAHVNEADYKEYSSYFWAALSGEDRLGEPVDRPDYDGDGRTCYLEAHAFALIESDSTDLSICTTDRLVRAMRPETDGPTLSKNSDFSALYAAADPVRRAVLDGLSAKLGLDGENRVEQAENVISDARRERRTLRGREQSLNRELPRLRDRLIDQLTDPWPALVDPKSDEALAAILDNADAIRAAITDEPAFVELSAKLDELAEIAARRDALTGAVARAERFAYACESVALIDTLLKQGGADTIAAYQAVLAREMRTPD